MCLVVNLDHCCKRSSRPGSQPQRPSERGMRRGGDAAGPVSVLCCSEFAGCRVPCGCWNRGCWMCERAMPNTRPDLCPPTGKRDLVPSVHRLTFGSNHTSFTAETRRVATRSSQDGQATPSSTHMQHVRVTGGHSGYTFYACVSIKKRDRLSIRTRSPVKIRTRSTTSTASYSFPGAAAPGFRRGLSSAALCSSILRTRSARGPTSRTRTGWRTRGSAGTAAAAAAGTDAAGAAGAAAATAPAPPPRELVRPLPRLEPRPPLGDSDAAGASTGGGCASPIGPRRPPWMGCGLCKWPRPPGLLKLLLWPLPLSWLAWLAWLAPLAWLALLACREPPPRPPPRAPGPPPPRPPRADRHDGPDDGPLVELADGDALGGVA